MKLQACTPTTLLKKRLWRRCFPVSFVKLLRIPSSTEHLRWLLLNIIYIFLKTSFVFVFRRRLQDVLTKTNMFALALRLQKMSSRHLQDVLVKTNIYVLIIRLQDVFKTFSGRLQDVFKTFSRRLQDVLQKRLQYIFKTF